MTPEEITTLAFILFMLVFIVAPIIWLFHSLLKKGRPC